MELNVNPSIIFGLYCKPNRYLKLLEELKNNNIDVREFRLIEVKVPMKRKDEILNFFKHFVVCNYWVDRKKTIFNSMAGRLIIKEVEKRGYKEINFKKDDWRVDTIHPLLYTLCCPLFIQDQSARAETEEEKQILEDILNFKSKGYKPDLKISKD